MIRLLFILVVLAFFGAAGYANQEQMVSLHFFDWVQISPIKLYQITAMIFLLGFLIAALLFCPSWMKALLAKRKLKKRVEQLEIDLDRIRSAALDTKETTSPRALAKKNG